MITGLGLVLASIGIGIVYSAVQDQSPTETLRELILKSRPEYSGTLTSELDVGQYDTGQSGSFGQSGGSR